MRNSEAQRYARWSLAMAGALALVVAGVYARNAYLARQAERKAPPAVPASIEQRSNEFSFSKVDGQRTIYTVKASRATEFKEGNRNLLEDVSIAVYGKKGDRNDAIVTRACEFISSTGQVSCAGDVQIRLQGGDGPQPSAHAVEVTTSAVTFDRESGEARTDRPVTFRWPSGEGRAVGMSYVSESGVLQLRHSVELSLSPSAPAAGLKTEPTQNNAAHVAGNSMTFARDQREVTLEGDVHAQQLTHELTAQKMLLELDPQFQAKRLVASGQPQLRDLSPPGPLALSADEISSSLRPDGSVESILASGHVRGSRNTPVGGDGIEAGRIQVELATRDNLPRMLTASNGVTLTSTSAAFNGGARRVQSDALEVHFASDSRAGQLRIESINTLAPARVDWENAEMVKGKSVQQTTRMNGKQLNLRFDAENQLQELIGTGGVEVTRKSGDSPEEVAASRELTALFDKTGQWSTIEQTGDVRFHDDLHAGRADRARTDRATNTVSLSGSVVFADPAMRTTAQIASYAQATSTLRADGHVQTADLRPSSSSIANLAPEPAHISAEHLVADTARGHAIYSGKGRLWQGQSVIEGDTIELDSPTHVMQVKGQVRGVFPEAVWNPKTTETAAPLAGKAARQASSKGTIQANRSGPQLGRVRGGLLTYWETESRGRMEQDARVDSEQGSIQADVIDLYFSDNGAATNAKQLTRSVASGGVVVRQEDRRGTSERAEYTASEGKFVLSEGKPTLYSSTGDTTTGRQLTFYFADDRIVVDSTDGSKTVTLHQVEK